MEEDGNTVDVFKKCVYYDQRGCQRQNGLILFSEMTLHSCEKRKVATF